MINLEIAFDKLKEEYPSFYNFFKNTLQNSQSRFKNYDESKYKCYYYVGFYMKPSQKTDDYYDKLYKMKWDERIIEEYKKTRVTISMISGKFAISDQTTKISKSIEPILNEIIARKMYIEQSHLENPNDDILNSIPNLNELIEKIEIEKKSIKLFIINNKEIELEPQEKLNKLIEEEKYEEAEKLIKKYPKLKKR